jgi:hypothetical protein
MPEAELEQQGGESNGGAYHQRERAAKSAPAGIDHNQRQREQE